MPRRLFGLVFIVAILLAFTPKPISEVVPPQPQASPVLGFEGERAYVSEVIDGDTVKLSDDRVVRLIGVDTPETRDPRRPVGCWGKEAANETKSLLLGKEIIMQKDISESDKYGRLLRFIYLPLEDGTILFVNDYLVRAGFGEALIYPPDVKYEKRLRLAEEEAKAKKSGLWGRCRRI